MLYSNYKVFNNKNIFITGGTGSFGSFFIKKFLKKRKPKKIICFSRDELKQFNLQNDLKKLDKKSSVRFFIGDVRDQNRLNLALVNNEIDFLIHAAALKQVPAVEYNPFEQKNKYFGCTMLLKLQLKQY